MTIISKMLCLSFLFLLCNCDTAGEQKSEPEVKTVEPTVTNLFAGGIMSSVDQGQTWKKLEGELPNIEVRALTVFGGQVYVGYTKKKVFSYNMDKKGDWKTENLEELFIHSDKVNDDIVGLYTIEKEVFATTMFGDMFHKQDVNGRWLPMKKPEDHQFIGDIKKDSEGKLYVASDYGLYSTTNNGKSWEQRYSMGTLYDFEFIGDNIVVSGNKGIFTSNDKGKTWQKSTTEENTIINMSTEESRHRLLCLGDEVVAMGLNYKTALGGSFIQMTRDNGKTWQKHPMDASLAKLQNVSQLGAIGNTLFCSHKEGLSRSTDGGKTWRTVLKYTSDEKNMTALGMYVHEGQLYCYEVMAGC